LVGPKAKVEGEDVGEPSKYKTLANVDIEISSNLEEEEDLARFEDVMSATSRAIDALTTREWGVLSEFLSIVLDIRL